MKKLKILKLLRLFNVKRFSNLSYFPSIYRIVLLSSFCTVFTTCSLLAENDSSSQPGYAAAKTVAPRPPHSDSSNSPVKPELKRISENGGEVLIDGSLRVYEPIIGKVWDLVETSTPVTPAANHVRLFAVAIGTATAIKAIFDDGTIKFVTNN